MRLVTLTSINASFTGLVTDIFPFQVDGWGKTGQKTTQPNIRTQLLPGCHPYFPVRGTITQHNSLHLYTSLDINDKSRYKIEH